MIAKESLAAACAPGSIPDRTTNDWNVAIRRRRIIPMA